MTPAARLRELIELERTGLLPDVLVFWGHGPRRRPGIGIGCLNPWYPAPFTVDGVAYATAEHYLMAAKARLFGDEAAERDVLATSDPGRARGIGRRVRGFDEDTWAALRYDLAVAANTAKFGQNPMLSRFLFGTRVIAEASPGDLVWGIGVPGRSPEARLPSRWRGLNLLGFALMEAHRRLAGKWLARGPGAWG